MSSNINTAAMTNSKPYVHVSTTVSKLGANIPSINLPAGLTCNPDAPCHAGCYAKRGRFLYSSVKECHMRNLLAYKGNPNLYFESIAVQTALARYARWHSSGDIVDLNYLKGMCKVARKNPTVQYLAFTKQYMIVNEFLAKKHRIPNNLTIVFSCWKGWIPENPYNLPTTWVYFPKEKVGCNEFIPKDAKPCPGKCATCQQCWNLKKGGSVVFRKH